jgi:hypothetical protein
MRFSLFLACTIAATACGPAGPSPELGATGQFGTYDPRTGEYSQSSMVPAQTRPPDTLTDVTTKRAVALLPSIYAGLGIPVTSFDPKMHLIGSSNQPVTLQVAGLRPSMVLDCGLGAYGPNADRYQVSLTIFTGVSGDSLGPAVVETRLSARAVPNGLSSYVPCASTGRLEETIAQRLRATK